MSVGYRAERYRDRESERETGVVGVYFSLAVGSAMVLL